MSYKPVAAALQQTLAIALLAIPLVTESAEKPTPGFHWVEEKIDSRLWRKIQDAFVEELTPDNPQVVGSQAAMGHKFIYRVGTYETSALVLVAAQRDASAQMQAHFKAFNYDTASGRKVEIPAPTASGVWHLRIVQLAHFERTPVPDIVFQFWDCVACEAQTLLASYRFDPAANEWRWRHWEKGASPHTGWTLVIGSSAEHGFDPEAQTEQDYVYHTSCVFRIGDLNGDGLDDVATWCREKVTAVEPPTRVRSITDTMYLFTAKDGDSKLQQVREARAAAALRGKICSTQMHAPPCNSSESERPMDQTK